MSAPERKTQQKPEFDERKRGEKRMIPWNGFKAFLSEVGSLQLEFFHLAYQTGKPEFADKPMKVFKTPRDQDHSDDGLFGVNIHPENGASSGEFFKSHSHGFFCLTTF